ncbi:MAG: DUF2059 domain-containing protein [Novosphingobium sp.]|nr:DUF2059 domain-containing protein [Novosphingobium sp.]
MKRLKTLLAATALAALPLAAQAEDSGPALDPTRLKAAEATVDYVFPTGTYARIMDKTMESVMGSVMKGAFDIPLRDLAAMSGKSDEELQKLGNSTLSEIMAILDPVYEERMGLTSRVMMTEMGKLMTQFEPSIRDGLSRAYAKRFDAEQLADLNRFFATPTGKAYAADSMIIFMDPEVMSKMQEFMPVMMKQMPALMGKVKDAVKDLPKPRKPSDLAPEERGKLADLLGVPETELDDNTRGFGLEAAE